jgi:hypothetical protein
MWVKDPTTKKPSVSLTLLCVAAALMVIFICLEAVQMLKSTYLLDEFFVTTCGLYFGRRLGADTKIDFRADKSMLSQQSQLPQVKLPRDERASPESRPIE